MTRDGINRSSGGNRRIFIGRIFYVNGKSLAIAFDWSRGGKFFDVNESD
jgi:hypothetical protein